MPSSILARFNILTTLGERRGGGTTEFLIVEPSPRPLLIPLELKYSPQDPVFRNP